MFFTRNVLFFLGGLAVGSLATVAICKNKDKMKPLAASLLSYGIDAKNAVMTQVETVKENVEDLVAEAQDTAEKRRQEP